jgi:hypothetical protein
MAENQGKQVRENSGALFINDRKQSDNHPDRQGSLSVTIDGVVHEFWISGWDKVSGSGTEYISLAVKPKDDQQRQPRQQQRPQGQQGGSRQGGQQGGYRGGRGYPS